MDIASVDQIIQTIFGGSISIQGVINLLMPIYVIIVSIVEWRSKVKLIKADKQLTSADKKLDAQREELNKVKDSIKYLGDMICTAYLRTWFNFTPSILAGKNVFLIITESH